MFVGPTVPGHPHYVYAALVFGALGAGASGPTVTGLLLFVEAGA